MVSPKWRGNTNEVPSECIQPHMMILKIASIFAFSAILASAIPMNITVGSNGALLNGTGVANKAQYGSNDNNPGSNLSFLQTEIGYWNALPSADLPLEAGPVSQDLGSLGDISSYKTLAGYNYVVFHFGNGGAGSPGGWWQAFYLGGIGGDWLAVPTVAGNTVGGFSSARYFGGVSVPEGGATIALLGAGMMLLGLACRRVLA